jgi:predicted membrane chloride channel (bestrophin family)
VLAYTLKTLRHFASVIDRHTLVVTVLALLAVFLCRRVGLVLELPFDLLGIAVVFPIVFSINSAYRRREDALKLFASLRASAVGLYFAHRDWPAAPDPARLESARQTIQAAFAAMIQHLQDSSADTHAVYASFSQVSRSIEALRQAHVAPTELSRASQYLRFLVFDFEQLSNIARYRTPLSLRAYSRVFLNLFPVVFAPHFAHVAYPKYAAVGYLLAVLYSLVLVGLDNVQDQLENPFDLLGPDDLRFELTKQYLDVLDEDHPTTKDT